MIYKLFRLLILFPSIFGTTLTAQVRETLPNIPDEIRMIISEAAKQDLFVVNGRREFASNVIVTDQLIFQDDGSTLVFTNKTVPYIIIFANELRLNDVGHTYTIRYHEEIIAADGGVGSNGGAGSPSYVHNQGTGGRHGGHGSDGEPGVRGQTLPAPPEFLIAGKIFSQNGDASNAGIRLFFPGIPGGNGGTGGNGGDGGSGESGDGGSDRLLSCHRGPGKGGNAGDGGKYGLGGRAGNGSNGSDIYLVGATDTVDILGYFPIRNIGGFPGAPGPCGQSGSPGMTGDQGALTTYCRSGPGAGSTGKRPRRPSQCTGDEGQRGDYGRVYSVTSAEIDALFE